MIRELCKGKPPLEISNDISKNQMVRGRRGEGGGLILPRSFSSTVRGGLARRLKFSIVGFSFVGQICVCDDSYSISHERRRVDDGSFPFFSFPPSLGLAAKFRYVFVRERRTRIRNKCIPGACAQLRSRYVLRETRPRVCVCVPLAFSLQAPPPPAPRRLLLSFTPSTLLFPRTRHAASPMLILFVYDYVCL